MTKHHALGSKNHMDGISNVMAWARRGFNYKSRHRHHLSSSTSAISTKRRPLLNDSTIIVQRLNECSFIKKPNANDDTSIHNRSTLSSKSKNTNNKSSLNDSHAV